MTTPDSLEELEARLGHVFTDKALARQALTHISRLPADRPRIASYQRMEFLGDRVLGLAVSAMLFEAFPRAEEGELSRRLAALVRKETCAEVAIAWDIGPHIRLGEHEALAGGRTKPAILSDICESLIGAIFLDAGFVAAAAVVRAAWSPRMQAAVRSLRDPKTALQEWAQGIGRASPVYREVDRSGPAHAPVFTVAVDLQGVEPGVGSGPSKRAAEQAAAQAVLSRENIQVERP